MSACRTLSVIVPVRNKAPHIRRSIASVLNQTFGDFELIVIDDASTDGSLEEILKFQDARIRVLHRDTCEHSPSLARNTGIAEATGKWIAFLDADDEWLPQHLQKMMELAEQFPDCDFLSCGWTNAYANGRTVVDRFSQRNRAGGAREISFKEYLRLCVMGMRPTCVDVACVRNNRIVRYMFPGKAARGEDLHAWLIYLAHAKKLAWSPHVSAVYNHDSVNMVTKTASYTPVLPLAIIDEVSDLLARGELRLLRRYCNRRLWMGWKGTALLKPDDSFSLAGNLSWRDDLLFCITHSAVSLVPTCIFRGAWRVKRRLVNLITKHAGEPRVSSSNTEAAK
jgi:glycosyltransferase involved in cell wall biosynthesis